MAKFVRLVIEEEIPEGALPIEKLTDKIKKSMQDWLELLEKDPRSAAECLEISKHSYNEQFHTPA